MNPLCECGCGHEVTIARNNLGGAVRGMPNRFIHGHNMKSGGPDYRIVDGPLDTPCWIWQLHINADGYGMCYRDGRLRGAHRWYYERESGPVPDGLMLDHLCENRACVNPAHLEPVTNAENVRRGARSRMIAAGATGLRAVRLWFDLTQSELAEICGASQSSVGAWERGERRANDVARSLVDAFDFQSARQFGAGA